jgi:hypothetical protein
MKPNEYIRKYNLADNKGFDHRSFFADFTSDFISLVEFQQTSNWCYSKFKNCVKEIRQKWDSISNKAPGKLTEKMWGYFFATVVVPMREKSCGKELEQKKKKKEWEKRKDRDREWYHFNFEGGFMGAGFFDPYRIFSAIFKNLSNVQIPKESFSILSLSSDVSKDEVKDRFKKLAFQTHPDHGGNADQFRKIVEAKNQCLQYLESI